jgi:hypothetical protein
MARSKPKVGFKPRPSAEMMSLRTGRPIGNFPKQPRSTLLGDEIIVQSESQINENLLEGGKSGEATQPPKPSYNLAKPKSTKAPDASKSVTDQTREALEKIGGILTLLPPDARFAVLKKINGVFGQSEKPAESKKSKSSPKANVKPSNQKSKNSFNEEILKTHIGMVLSETSRTMKQVAKDSKAKPSDELYELHRWALSEKSLAKEGITVIPPATSNLDGKKLTGQLLAYYKAIKSQHVKENISAPTPASIFEVGMCLIRGEAPQFSFALTGKVPDVATCPEASRTVPRTDEEAEKRADAILASKKSRKQQEKDKPDNQVPLQKRAKPNEPSTKESDSPLATSRAAVMEMETE